MFFARVFIEALFLLFELTVEILLLFFPFIRYCFFSQIVNSLSNAYHSFSLHVFIIKFHVFLPKAIIRVHPSSFFLHSFSSATMWTQVRSTFSSSMKEISIIKNESERVKELNKYC